MYKSSFNIDVLFVVSSMGKIRLRITMMMLGFSMTVTMAMTMLMESCAHEDVHQNPKSTGDEHHIALHFIISVVQSLAGNVNQNSCDQS